MNTDRFAEYLQCERRIHCAGCRENPARFKAPEVCPFGVTVETVPASRTSVGPGVELKALLSSIGIKPGNCSCNTMAAKMDAWGIVGCEEHQDEIVAHLEKQAFERGWVMVIGLRKIAARELLRRAIENFRQKCS